MLGVGVVRLQRHHVCKLVHQDVTEPFHPTTRPVERATGFGGNQHPIPARDGETIELVGLFQHYNMNLLLEVVVELGAHRLPVQLGDLSHLAGREFTMDVMRVLVRALLGLRVVHDKVLGLDGIPVEIRVVRTE